MDGSLETDGVAEDRSTAAGSRDDARGPTLAGPADGGRAAADGGPAGAVTAKDAGRHWLWLALMIAGAVLTNFTRAAGLPLVLAAMAWLALGRRWRDLGVFAGVFFPLAFLWWLWGHQHGAVSYASHLWAIDPYQPKLGNMGVGSFAARVANNALRYAGMHLPILLAWDGSRWPFAVAVLLLAIAGWARRLRRPGVAELWTPLYVGLILVWPATWSGERFLLPLYPLLLCYAAEAARDALARLRAPRAAAWIAAAALVLLALAGAEGFYRVGDVGLTCSARYRDGEPFPCMGGPFHDFFAVAAKARGALPPGSAVLSRKATLFFALSGYPSRTYPLSASPDTFFAAARAAGARYVMYDDIPDLAPMYLHPVLLSHRDDFCVVKGLSLPEAAVMRIEPGSPKRTGVAENSFRICDQPPSR